ncbi:hypothetical protein Tco_1441887, partial [Tanacetum coccineum]
VASRGWSFASAVPGQMTHLVPSLKLASENSCVMQGAFCTQRKISLVLFSIPFVLSWGGSISSDSFLPSILLFMVIVAMVVIVLVVVVVIVGSGVPSIIKILFVIVGSFSCYWSSDCPGVPISIYHEYNEIFLEFKTSRDRYGNNGKSDSIGNLVFLDTNVLRNRMSGGDVVDLTSDEDPTNEDGGTGMGDSTGVSMSLGDEISLGGKKSRKSNIGGGGKNSMSKRYLVKLSEELGEMFLGEAGK